MGQVRHGSATTTHAIRAAIQRSQASLSTLSRELGISPKTVAKWRKRQTLEELETGPKDPRSTTLSEAEEAMVVAFRRHTLLPLDDCLYALQSNPPNAGIEHREFGVRVIGEGVEQETERRMLAEMGCSLAQGNLFSPPLPAADFQQIARG